MPAKRKTTTKKKSCGCGLASASKTTRQRVASMGGEARAKQMKKEKLKKVVKRVKANTKKLRGIYA